jgi:integrase
MTDSLARRLTDAKVRAARPADRPVKITDGGGLFLLVKPNGARLWRYKYRINGREGLLALGAYPDLSLAAARDAHRAARALVAAGRDPVQARQDDRAEATRQARLDEISTFEAVVASWRETTDHDLAENTIAQRTREIGRHVLPAFADRRIDTIRRRDIADLIKRIEARAPETARNVRNHLNGIAEHAIGLGLIDANPVPPPGILRRRKQTPHRALAEADLPAFLRAVDAAPAEIGTRSALLLVILTASRKSEITGASWSEIDLDAGEWLVPAARMKARRDHLIPLPRQAVEILRELQAFGGGAGLVFPNRRDPGRAMASRTLNEYLRRIGFAGVTVHGFRSVFSTRFNRLGRNPDAIEACLAHAPANAVRAAYNRHDYRAERRELLQEWADHLDAIRAPNVVGLRA